jgi:hypothetical protein
MFCPEALLSLANRLTARLEPLQWDQSKMERFALIHTENNFFYSFSFFLGQFGGFSILDPPLNFRNSSRLEQNGGDRNNLPE